MLVLAAAQLMTVHMVDGAEVSVNPRAITMMRKAREEDDPRRETPPGVNCVLWFMDGRYLSIVETCLDVVKMIDGETYPGER